MNYSILALKYNNMFNRLIKRLDTVDEYISAGLVMGLFTNVQNFNFADGVSTSQVIELEGVNSSVVENWGTTSPDYVILVNEDGTINSRWFCIDCVYIRATKYTLGLKRDTIADNLNAVLASTCFIQKGYIRDENPLIYSSENVLLNQVKSGEYPITNNIGSAWAVAYLARYKADGTGYEYEGKFKNDSWQADYATVESFPYWRYSFPDILDGRAQIGYPTNRNIRFVGRYKIGTQAYFLGGTDLGNSTVWENAPYSATLPEGVTADQLTTIDISSTTVYDKFLSAYVEPYEGTLPTNTYTNLISQGDQAKLYNEDGKTAIDTGTGVIYRFDVVETSKTFTTDLYDPDGDTVEPTYHYIKVPSGSALAQAIVNEIMVPAGITNASLDECYIIVSSTYLEIYYDKVDITGTVTANAYDFDYLGGAVTRDAPYEIVATPINNVTFTNVNTTYEHSGAVGYDFIVALANKYNGEGACYDVQIVPYVGIDDLDITQYGSQLIQITDGGTTPTLKAIAIQLPLSSFSAVYSLTIPQSASIKESVNADLYRIVSPNGVGSFEFSAVKNGGVGTFEVDVTLLPFNPYIKVNPLFSNLYGRDYNDYRGLICGGEFSLPIINNAWQTYQLSNKYYQDIFNREIESQEFNNKYAQISDWLSVGTGAASGGMSGAMVGQIAGASQAGAAIGAGLSAAGGIADAVVNQKIREESIDKQRDVFGLNLRTIQARSQSLTRSTAYNINNKYFPYVEYYTATSQEKALFNKMLKWRGMSVGAIDTISNYIEPGADWTFIQASLIEIDIVEDSHIAQDIDYQLRGGIRFA